MHIVLLIRVLRCTCNPALSSIVFGGTRSKINQMESHTDLGGCFSKMISYFGIYSLLKMRDFLGKITKRDILGKTGNESSPIAIILSHETVA